LVKGEANQPAPNPGSESEEEFVGLGKGKNKGEERDPGRKGGKNPYKSPSCKTGKRFRGHETRKGIDRSPKSTTVGKNKGENPGPS